jgi:hypothetical protein
MGFEVRYLHPNVFVRNCSTNETHKFVVGDNGALAPTSRFDLGDARRAAIAHLYKLHR